MNYLKIATTLSFLSIVILSCKKEESQILTDADGNIYPVVQIGSQLWMGENLKTTRYNDNDSIPLVTDNASWASLSTPGYCWYHNDETLKNTYGALYNWFSVNTGKICPAGWHVPNNEEYDTLVSFLGGPDIAGGKLKENGTTHWSTPNLGATNESNFSAFPAGCRVSGPGMFFYIGILGYYWTSSSINTTDASMRMMSYYTADIQNFSHDKRFGLSIRCIKNNN